MFVVHVLFEDEKHLRRFVRLNYVAWTRSHDQMLKDVRGQLGHSKGGPPEAGPPAAQGKFRSLLQTLPRDIPGFGQVRQDTHMQYC